MPRDRYDPFKDETLGQKPKRKPPVKIDWKAAARQLAEGGSAGKIAAGIGVTEDRLWRHLRISPHFRYLLQQAVERQRLLGDLQLSATARMAAVRRSLQPDGLDADTLQQLACAADSVSDGKALVGRLADTGLRPEAAERRSRRAEEEARRTAMQAEFRARIAENRRREAEQRALEDEARAAMHAKLAARRVALEAQAGRTNAAEASGGPAAAAAASADGSAGAPEATTSISEAPTNISEAATNIAEAPESAAEAVSGMAEAAVTGAAVPGGKIVVDPEGCEWFIPDPEPDEPPLPPSLASIYRSTTDLNGPFATPAAGAGALQKPSSVP